MHLNYLRIASYFSLSWIPFRVCNPGAAVVDGLMATSFVYWCGRWFFHTQLPESMFSRNVWWDPQSHCISWSKELDKPKSGRASGSGYKTPKIRAMLQAHDLPSSRHWSPIWEVRCSMDHLCLPIWANPTCLTGQEIWSQGLCPH